MTRSRALLVVGVLIGLHGSAGPGSPQACDALSPCQACYSGDQSQISIGTCRAGTQNCFSGGPCLGERLPEPEQCDGLDHDCNGIPNDRPGGCACSPGSSRLCYTGPPDTNGFGTCQSGIQTCAPGATWGACIGDIAPQYAHCQTPSCTGGPNPGCDCPTCFLDNFETGDTDRWSASTP